MEAISIKQGNIYRVNQLHMNVATRSAYFHNQAIPLTGLEFNLLKVIMMNAGCIVTRENIANAVFHKSLQLCDKSINSHILNIRKKIANASGDECIKTVRGKGYILLGN